MQTKHLSAFIYIRNKVRFVPSNMFKPSINFLIDRSKTVLLFWIVFVVCVSCINYIVCSLQPCGHLLGKAGPLALLYVMFSCVLSLSHMVSWVRCGTWLYGFLIFAFLLILIYWLWICWCRSGKSMVCPNNRHMVCTWLHVFHRSKMYQPLICLSRTSVF